MKQRVISLRTLAAKEFKVLPFEGYWRECFGQPEANAKWLFYGRSGSGKSTLVLRLCDYLARWGKVAYNSWEEGIAKTFQDRVSSNGITRLDKIFLLERYTWEEMMSDEFKRKHYRVIVIDSTNWMGLAEEQYYQLVARYPSKIFILISQVNGKGAVKGGTGILHAVDVKVRCHEGQATVQSRFAPQKQVQIFERKPKAGETIPLDLIHRSPDTNP